MRNQLRQFRIRPDALSLIERILGSCIDMDKKVADIRFDHSQSVTLEDLRRRFPIPAIGLHQVCVANGNKGVNRQNVIQLFAGPIHARAVKDRLENPNQIIVATGQLFLARMKEVGIHFLVPANRVAFGLLDLAMPARVDYLRERKTQLKIWNISVMNVVIPPGMQLSRAQWVLTHMGAVITKLSERQVAEIRRLQKQGPGLELIGGFTTALKNKSINCENFCPSAPNKKDGCNLTVWNLERL